MQMIFNLNMILRVLLFFTLIFLSILFFFLGYQELRSLDFVNSIKINQSKTNDLEEKIKKT